MRSIPSGVTTLQNLRRRKPYSKMVARDVRLRFDKFAPGLNPFYTSTPMVFGAKRNAPGHRTSWADTPIPFNCIDHAINPNTNTIAGILGYGALIYHRRVATPYAIGDWTTWSVNATTGCISGSRPGICYDTVNGKFYFFTHETGGAIRRMESSNDAVGWAGITTVYSAWPPSGYATNVAIAPIGKDEAFLCGVDNSDLSQRLTVYRLFNGVLTAWPNTVYDDIYTFTAMTAFDAVALADGRRLVFFSSKDEGRTMVCQWHHNVWSPPKPVIPLDLVDTTSLFRLSSVTVIQNVIWLTGRLVRPSTAGGTSVSIDVLIRSADGVHWTMDRNSFIQGTEGRGQIILGNTNFVYYCCLDDVFRAPSTYLIDPAGDPAGERTTLTEVESIAAWQAEYPTADGAAGTFSADLVYKAALVWPDTPDDKFRWNDGKDWQSVPVVGVNRGHPNVRDGAWLWLYAGYDGGSYILENWETTQGKWNAGPMIWPSADGDSNVFTLMDIYDVDIIQYPNRQVSVNARSAIAKMLKHRALQDYIYLSQCKWTDDYTHLGKIVSIGGLWSVSSNILKAEDANNANVLWFSGHEGVSSGLGSPNLKVQYRFDGTTIGIKGAGLLLNGKDNSNYWFVKATATAIELVERVNGTDQAASATYSKTHVGNTWYHLMAYYRGGRFLIYERDASATTWTLAIDFTFSSTDRLPAFGRDEGLVGLRADVSGVTLSSDCTQRTGNGPTYTYKDVDLAGWDLSQVNTTMLAYQASDSSRWGRITSVNDSLNRINVIFDTNTGAVINGGTAIRVVDPNSAISFQRPLAFDERWDQNTATLIQEMGTVGGIVSFDLDYTINQSIQVLDWWSSVQDTAVDLNFRLPTFPDPEKHVFIAMRSTTQSWATMKGTAIGFSWTGFALKVKLILRDGTTYLSSTDDKEVIILPNNEPSNSGPVCRVVAKDEFVTVYVNRIPVAGFWDNTNTAVGYFGVATDNPTGTPHIFDLQSYDLREWRSAEFLEMNTEVGGGIARMIDDRDIHWFGRGLTLRASRFATRSSLGTWRDAVFEEESGPSDLEVASILRTVGVEIVEELDEATAREHGLVYAETQVSAAENIAQMNSMTTSLLARSRQYAKQAAVQTPAMLNAESEDKVTISYTAPDLSFGVTDDYIINDVAYHWGGGVFEMEAGVRQDA